jgi:hypothetical protein
MIAPAPAPSNPPSTAPVLALGEGLVHELEKSPADTASKTRIFVRFINVFSME